MVLKARHDDVERAEKAEVCAGVRWWCSGYRLLQGASRLVSMLLLSLLCIASQPHASPPLVKPRPGCRGCSDCTHLPTGPGVDHHPTSRVRSATGSCCSWCGSWCAPRQVGWAASNGRRAGRGDCQAGCSVGREGGRVGGGAACGEGWVGCGDAFPAVAFSDWRICCCCTTAAI